MFKIKKETIIVSSIAILSAILFMVIAIIVYNNGGEIGLDNSIKEGIYNIRGEKGGFINYLFRFITEFGYLYAAILIGVIGIFYTKIDRGLIIYAIGFILSATLNGVFKIMFDRQRPDAINQWMVDDESSFPSGHSNTVAYVYSFVTYYIFKKSKKNWLKYGSFGFTIVIIPLVMLSRLFLGMHYFTDVVAGMCVGLFSFAMAAYLYMIFERYDLFTEGFIKFKGKNNEEESINS